MAARKKAENEFAQSGSSKPRRSPRKKKEAPPQDSFEFEQVSPAYGSGRLRAKLSLAVIATLHVGFLIGVFIIGLKNAPPASSATALDLLKASEPPRVDEDVFDEIFEKHAPGGATNLTQIANELSSQPLPGADPDVEAGSPPEEESTASQTASNDPEPAPAPSVGVWVVKSGDTLSKIAREMGTTVKALQEKNNIEGALIRVGQELKRP